MKMELVVFCKPCLKQLQDWAWGLNERALNAACCSQWLGRALTASFPKLRAFPMKASKRPWWVAILTKATAANALGVACVSLLRGVPSAGSTVKYGKGVSHATGLVLVAGIQGNIAKETGAHWDQVAHTVSYMLIFTGTCCWSSPPKDKKCPSEG